MVSPNPLVDLLSSSSIIDELLRNNELDEPRMDIDYVYFILYDLDRFANGAVEEYKRASLVKASKTEALVLLKKCNNCIS